MKKTEILTIILHDYYLSGLLNNKNIDEIKTFFTTQNNNQIILPKNKEALLLVSGAGINIKIQKDIAEFIKISNHGAGTNVSEI